MKKNFIQKLSVGNNKEKGISRILLEFNKNIHQATKRDKGKIGFWSSGLEKEVIIICIKKIVKLKL